jgi:hypothetical protein
MTAWQYAQLTITRDIRASEIQTIVWRGPGQGFGENFTGSGQSVLELLKGVGADGWSWLIARSARTAAMGPATGIPTGPSRSTPSRTRCPHSEPGGAPSCIATLMSRSLAGTTR